MTASMTMSSGRARTNRTSGSDRPGGPSARSIRYQPALDGVRALSVLVVLLFHAEVTGFSGGYLGVSVFFTLSGFLITTLLVEESERSRAHGRPTVAVGAFYARRARRLLPASIACIVGIVVLSGVTDWFDGVSQLRRDVIGSLLQVANWVFLLGGGSYQELFDQAAGTVSPLEHYWSLAIEEQFYWLWPVAFLGLTRLAGTPRGRTRALMLLTALAALTAPFVAVVWGPDAAYWATPARAAEILFGALLAVLVHGRALDRRWSRLALPALGLLTIAVVTFPAVGGPAYEGALPLVAMVSAALLLGLQVEGPVRRALSIRPLVWIGTISYGVYLYHWPLFLILDEQRTGLDGPALLALRFAATFALAEVSFLVLERPIRTSSLPRRPTLVGAVAATAAAIALAVAVIPAGADEYWSLSDEAAASAAIVVSDEPLVAAPPVSTAPDGEAVVAPTEVPVDVLDKPAEELPDEPPAEEPAAASPTTVAPVADGTVASPPDATAPPPVAPEQPPLPPLERPVRILVAGDSTAQATAVGLVHWAADNPELAQVEPYTIAGCGFMKGGTYLLPEGRVTVSEGCTEFVDELIPQRAADTRADVVALLTTSWDVQDRAWDDGVEGPTTDPRVAERLRTDLIGLTERILAGSDAAVAWIREPISDARWEEEVLAQEEVERHEIVYSVMDELAARHPGRVHVLDLPAFIAERGLATDQEARPDGIHWTPEAATTIAGEYLGEQLIRSALDLEPR
jgi:peptidoglycan/LPS O-acetylase OafA/YrhL